MTIKKRYFVLIVSLFLLLGFSYYYFFRTQVVGLLWINIENINEPISFVFLSYLNWFPTFIHPFLFSLLSWWAMGFKYPKSSIGFWLVINLIFEMGQSIQVDKYDFLPTILQKYFINGTFDWWDMFSIILGAVSAYIFIIKFKRKEKNVLEKNNF